MGRRALGAGGEERRWRSRGGGRRGRRVRMARGAEGWRGERLSTLSIVHYRPEHGSGVNEGDQVMLPPKFVSAEAL
jgi:hypothetical protein